MLATFVTLFTAHLVGDFVLQPGSMVQNKRRWPVLISHALIVTLLTALALRGIPVPLLPVVFLTHLTIDFIKARVHDSATTFVADQLAHVVVLLLLAAAWPDAAADGWLPVVIQPSEPFWYAGLCLVSGFVLAVPAGGMLIGKLTAPLGKEIQPASRIRLQETEPPDTPDESSSYLTAGLTNGGMYIGWLERFLAMMLVLIGQPSGIGFLIAAKSILRFGEIKDASHRKVAEYIIIGTFLSFGWAILMATLTQLAIRLWLPA